MDGFQWHLAFLAPQFLEARTTMGEGGRSSGGRKLHPEDEPSKRGIHVVLCRRLLAVQRAGSSSDSKVTLLTTEP